MQKTNEIGWSKSLMNLQGCTYILAPMRRGRTAPFRSRARMRSVWQGKKQICTWLLKLQFAYRKAEDALLRGSPRPKPSDGLRCRVITNFQNRQFHRLVADTAPVTPIFRHCPSHSNGWRAAVTSVETIAKADTGVCAGIPRKILRPIQRGFHLSHTGTKLVGGHAEKGRPKNAPDSAASTAFFQCCSRYCSLIFF